MMPEQNNSLKLSKIEKLAIQGIQSREREIQEKLINPLMEDWEELRADIAETHGLSRLAIGTTHNFDFDNWTIVEIPQKEDAPVAAELQPDSKKIDPKIDHKKV